MLMCFNKIIETAWLLDSRVLEHISKGPVEVFDHFARGIVNPPSLHIKILFPKNIKISVIFRWVSKTYCVVNAHLYDWRTCAKCFVSRAQWCFHTIVGWSICYALKVGDQSDNKKSKHLYCVWITSHVKIGLAIRIKGMQQS